MQILARVLNGKSGNTCAPGRKALNNEGFSQYMDDTPSSISEIEDIVQEDQDAFKPSTSLPTAETGHVERPKVDDHTNAESIRLTMDQSTEDSMCSDKFIGYKDIIFQQQKLLQTQVYQQQEILEALKRIQLTSDMPPPPLQGSPDPKYGRPKSAFSVVSASVSPAYSPKQRKESENIDPATSQPNASRPKSPNPGLQVSYNHTHTPVESHYSTDASENGFIDQTMPNMSQKPEYPSSSSDTTTSIFPPRIFIHANNNNNTKQPMAQQYQQYLQPVGITPYGVQPVIYYGAQPILKEDEEEDECQCSECLDDNSHIYSSTAPSSNAGNNDKPKDNQHPEQQKPTPPKTPFYRKPKNLIMIAGLMAMGLKAMNGMERKRKKKAEEEYKAMHKKEKKKEKEKHKKSQGEQEKLVQETVQNANPTSQHILVQSASVPQPNMLVYPAYRPPPPQPVSVITYSSYCSLGNQHNSTPNYPSLPPRAQTTLNAPSNPNLIQNPSNVNCNPCNSNPQNYVYHSFSNNIGTHFGPRF
ncbi:hypothetical protein H4219_000086 [Mycoemilia scoparia]|uniref:Uncharacterized protein n=1 Tax=Mycoemilia scoparia TaxID=417184 RepID=A0A9W8DRX6_9FUNG|nr:hypothetical protein H4219_000086 [Mycoemilia scoparia]